jgi:hypothetical protein
MARLLDVFAVLLAPLTAALDQEFGTRPAPRLSPVAAFSPTPVAVAVPVAETGPLFVAVGEGRGRRYRLDNGQTTGPKFRKVVLACGRTKYVAA